MIPAGKAGCLLEKPLKINRFGVIAGSLARKGNERECLNRHRTRSPCQFHATPAPASNRGGGGLPCRVRMPHATRHASG
ncbi:hypothetical protein EJA06_018175 [Pseudomonas songnenensis]|uniref:Uncharacterized protein n=1 Tax=Pseudomonas songnenensis TaxID=1176259 RepID=A0A482U2H4_9PSED|nr:hypothetical protein EA798_11735 [Pseudomonas songnenensis]RYJ60635.1 hypothetical protein EJA06_018175 [Pseudomonas songnenensis]